MSGKCHLSRPESIPFSNRARPPRARARPRRIPPRRTSRGRGRKTVAKEDLSAEALREGGSTIPRGLHRNPLDNVTIASFIGLPDLNSTTQPDETH